MKRFIAIVSICLAGNIFLATPSFGLTGNPALSAELESSSISQLEIRLPAIDRELAQLSEYYLRTGVGSIEYRSTTYPDPNHLETIRINLKESAVIDQIVLVPSIWRDIKTGLRADGFPVEFQIFAGTDDDPTGVLLASHEANQGMLLPRIAPLVISCPPTRASWIRLDATVLSPRLWDGRYVLQLSEIMVFSGQDDVALHQKVETSSSMGWLGLARDKRFLVDGFVPYLMNAHQGEKSLAFVSGVGIGDHPTLTIDLEGEFPLNRIHLHTADLSDTIPQAVSDDYGIARRWRVEGANRPDFSDARQMCEFLIASIYDTGPILMLAFPETKCRYVRLIAFEPYIAHEGENTGSQIALAEIELFSAGRNVALGKTVKPNFDRLLNDRSLTALTDGRNFYGQILPIREWMDQLARRHDLEVERPLVRDELSRRYARQKRNLSWMGWLAAALTGGIVIVFLVDRIIRLREVAKIKERFAADLHDELGANIHTIGLLSDAVTTVFDSPAELKMLNTRIRELTERTGTAIRHCTNMLEAEGLYIGLADDIRRTAQRNTALLEHKITITGEDHLERLKPRTRVDLFLFYKESLINACRHSGATQFRTELIAGPNDLSLTVSDNGKGMPQLPTGNIPAALSRRAHLLGASLTVETAPQHGTSIILKLKTSRFGYRK